MAIEDRALPARQPLGLRVLEYDGPDRLISDLRDDARRDPCWPAGGDFAEVYWHLVGEGGYPGALEALDRAWLLRGGRGGYNIQDVGAVTFLTTCERRAILRPYQGTDDQHTFHVAVVSFGCGRAELQVSTVLELDTVTRRRWTRQPWLHARELAAMMPVAADKARPCGRIHRDVTGSHAPEVPALACR